MGVSNYPTYNPLNNWPDTLVIRKVVTLELGVGFSVPGLGRKCWGP